MYSLVLLDLQYLVSVGGGAVLLNKNKYTPTPQLVSSSTRLCKCSPGFHPALDHQNQPQAAPSSQVTPPQ